MRAQEFLPGRESKARFVEMFSKFLPLAMHYLKLKNLPRIVFQTKIEHSSQPTFGMYVNGKNVLYVALVNRHPNDILRTVAHELQHYKQDTEHKLNDTSGTTGSPEENEAHAMAGIVMRHFNKKYPEYLSDRPVVFESWSKKYKKSINCGNPKGFSQRAHCAGRRKRQAGGKTKSHSVSESAVTIDPKFKQAVEYWQQMYDPDNSAKTILSSPASKPFRQCGGATKLYRAIVPQDREINAIKANGVVVAFARTVNGAVNFVQTLDTEEDWVIIEKNYNAGDCLLDYSKMVETLGLTDGDYVDEAEVWMKPTAYYKSAKKNEVVLTSKQYYSKQTESLNELDLSGRKNLVIFDIDDTLMHTTAQIKVVDKTGKVLRSLTNQEFNHYTLKPGEQFDFGEFKDAEKFNRESQPIEPMMNRLKDVLDNAPNANAIMLTARSDFDNKEKFLDTFRQHGIDMGRVHVHRAGNLPGDEIPAEKKAVWVRKYLNTGLYKGVWLYDDSRTNLKVFKELKKEYPEVNFHAVYVGPKGETSTAENFADGKIKGKSRPGRVKRAGASCSGSVTSLRQKAKQGGEKGKMYHWCANMKSGKKK